jgi:hypothetical protein
MRVGATELVLLLVLVVLPLIANWNIYKKMGEPGWKGIIPYYNTYVLCCHVWNRKIFWWIAGLSIAEIFFAVAGASSFNILFGLVIAVLSVGITIKEGDAFQKGVGFIIGMIVLPVVFKLILAFGNAEYRDPTGTCTQNEKKSIE